ncbi:hypothetical protein VRK_28970 [Vibrio sp. MEBiC08052]|nr:hypothetical protein VRK_28970 [Vibrio sp. MEBiC08052]
MAAKHHQKNKICFVVSFTLNHGLSDSFHSVANLDDVTKLSLAKSE